jgi:radical SAM/SPASM domain protein of ACGX system
MSNKCDDARSFGLQWHVTNKCDQRCKHCYIWGNRADPVPDIGNEMDFWQCKNVVDKFLYFCQQFKVKPVINITGGDPLLFRPIWDLLEYIRKQRIVFRVLGNPFHLDNAVCERLFSLGCRAYQMSLDGTKDTHDDIRMSGSFESTLAAIRRLKEHKVRAVIMSTVSRVNYREFPELIKTAVENEVDIFDFARYCPVNGDTNTQLSPQEYKDFLSQIWDVYVGLADRKTVFPMKDHLWVLWLYEKGLFQPHKGNIAFQGCHCGVNHLTVLPNGNVFACRRFDSCVGNIFSQPLGQIFLGEKLDRYREIDKMEGCKTCNLLNYCRGCHAVSYGVYGDFFARDPQCWKE